LNKLIKKQKGALLAGEILISIAALAIILGMAFQSNSDVIIKAQALSGEKKIAEMVSLVNQKYALTGTLSTTDDNLAWNSSDEMIAHDHMLGSGATQVTDSTGTLVDIEAAIALIHGAGFTDNNSVSYVGDSGLNDFFDQYGGDSRSGTGVVGCTEEYIESAKINDNGVVEIQFNDVIDYDADKQAKANCLTPNGELQAKKVIAVPFKKQGESELRWIQITDVNAKADSGSDLSNLADFAVMESSYYHRNAVVASTADITCIVGSYTLQDASDGIDLASFGC
jgi:Tfp pilus assembly protein PilE